MQMDEAWEPHPLVLPERAYQRLRVGEQVAKPPGEAALGVAAAHGAAALGVPGRYLSGEAEGRWRWRGRWREVEVEGEVGHEARIQV